MNMFVKNFVVLIAVGFPSVLAISSSTAKATIDVFNEIGLTKNEIQNWILKAVFANSGMGRADYLTCDVCHPALMISRPFVNLGGKEKELAGAIAKLCEFLNLAPSKEICFPTIMGYVEPIAYMLKTKPYMSDADFCGLVNKECGDVNATFTAWKTPLAGNKPPLENKDPPPANTKRTKIIQFTDIHLDLDYVEGQGTDCNLPICCRKDNKPKNDNAKAGPYGHRRCGLPLKALEEMYAHAKAEHADVKYIFLTGDYINAGVWLYSPSENSRHIDVVTNMLRDTFPTTTIIPLTGNHETPVVNMYPPPEIHADFPLDWMYKVVSEPFEKHMGTSGELNSFYYGGYYTVSPTPGLRFVIINTNICYIQNFWLPYNPFDPANQLRWFSQTMAKAELAQEAVYLIAHIPPGSGECWAHWSHQYARIVERYANNIRMQLFGHTHNEFYTVWYGADQTPVSVGLVAHSAVPDGDGVAYKVYYVDGERGADSTWDLLDHETWVLNVLESNAQKKPIWIKSFSASETFGLKSHRPVDYHDLTMRMTSDRALFGELKLLFDKKTSEHSRPCGDPGCTSGILCNTVNYDSSDRRMCDHVKRLVAENWSQKLASSAGFKNYLSLHLSIPVFFAVWVVS